MTHLRTFLFALGFAVVPAAAALAEPVDPKNPPQGRFSDEWGEIYMAGGKVGYMHSTIGRDGDRIHTETTTSLKIGRADMPVEIEMRQSTTETVDGKPLTFGSDMQAAMMKTTTRGTVAEGRVTIVTSQYGMEQTQAYAFPAGALMSWGLFRETLLRGFTPGTEYNVETYSPELRLDDSVPATVRVGDWEEFDHAGQRRKGQRVTVLLTTPVGPMEMKSWVDSDGSALKVEVPMPGLGNMVIMTTDQHAALADFVPPEIFLSTAIKANRSLDLRSTGRIKYRIRATKEDVDLSELPTTGMQSATKNADGSMDVVVTRQEHKPTNQGTSGHRTASLGDRLTPDQLAEYLGPNLMINTEDPELVTLAKRAADGKTEPYALGDKLRRFVTTYVTTKSLNIGFGTASEVCRTREGDCSEHGVLLAALGRINGLPSRVVVGLAYVPSFKGQEDLFGYHLWTQFYIDGRWVDFDAALKESECSPGRIAFATSSLKHTGLADLSLPLITKIGAIDIDILDVQETEESPE